VSTSFGQRKPRAHNGEQFATRYRLGQRSEQFRGSTSYLVDADERLLCAMSGHCEKLIRETAVSYLRRIFAID
jgi:hypothetical protein